MEWHKSFTKFDCFPEEKKHTPRPRMDLFFFFLVFVIFKKIARLIWPNWKAAAPMRLVQRRFQISQRPPPSIPFFLMLPPPPPHSFPSTHRLLASPVSQYLPSGNIQLLILAQRERGERTKKTKKKNKSSNMKGDNDSSSWLPR